MDGVLKVKRTRFIARKNWIESESSKARKKTISIQAETIVLLKDSLRIQEGLNSMTKIIASTEKETHKEKVELLKMTKEHQIDSLKHKIVGWRFLSVVLGLGLLACYILNASRGYV